MNANPRAIVFDLDWTLYDADAFYLDAWERVACAIAAPTGRDAAELRAHLVSIWRTEGPACPDLFNRWLQRCGGLPESPWLQRAVDTLHGDWTPQLEPYDGARDLLATLGKHFRLGLLTEGRAATQRRKIQALALGDVFHHLALGADKGNSDAYRQLCQRLGVHPANTLAIGDRPERDLEPALALGARTCLLRRGPFGASTTLPATAIGWSIADLRDLPAIVDAWTTDSVRARV